MTNYTVVVLIIAIVLIGGAVADHAGRNARQTTCEQGGGAFVLSTSGFICAKALQKGQP